MDGISSILCASGPGSAMLGTPGCHNVDVRRRCGTVDRKVQPHTVGTMSRKDNQAPDFEG